LGTSSIGTVGPCGSRAGSGAGGEDAPADEDPGSQASVAVGAGAWSVCRDWPQAGQIAFSSAPAVSLAWQCGQLSMEGALLYDRCGMGVEPGRALARGAGLSRRSCVLDPNAPSGRWQAQNARGVLLGGPPAGIGDSELRNGETGCSMEDSALLHGLLWSLRPGPASKRSPGRSTRRRSSRFAGTTADSSRFRTGEIGSGATHRLLSTGSKSAPWRRRG
jgi:hypothetical protein